ncbi:hypothetical protein MXD63_46245, partial [Frankia sp. Cpl3]|nr:hypothetical protein [Frankia sp. Cpl3]
MEAAIERVMKQLELDLETVFTRFAAWKQERLEGMGVNRFSDRFRRTREAILQVYQPLVDDVV